MFERTVWKLKVPDINLFWEKDNYQIIRLPNGGYDPSDLHVGVVGFHIPGSISVIWH